MNALSRPQQKLFFVERVRDVSTHNQLVMPVFLGGAGLGDLFYLELVGSGMEETHSSPSFCK